MYWHSPPVRPTVRPDIKCQFSIETDQNYLKLENNMSRLIYAPLLLDFDNLKAIKNLK